MGSSLPIGKVFGINVRIDTTLFLLFLYFAYLGYAGTGLRGALDQLTLLVFLFISIFLHEMGHAGAAAAFGIRTHDVTLHFFGGYARLSEPPRRPLEEAAIAVAGPIVNLSLALGLYGLLRSYGRSEGFEPYENLVGTLAFANLLLGAFNLLPGVPLDGGSFVRAILSLWLSRPLARMIVACLGVLIGFGLAAYAVANTMILTAVLGLLLALIAAAEAVAARRAM
jgi:Zn-dependent protease